MNVYILKEFEKSLKKSEVTTGDLIKASDEICDGLIDADLGAFCIKKRIATANKGKRGSYRTIVSYKTKSYIVFIYMFAKNDRDNITIQELVAFKKTSKVLSKLDKKGFDKLIKHNVLVEIRSES